MKRAWVSAERFVADLWRILATDVSALLGGTVVALYLLIAIIGPYITHVSNVQNPADAYLPPSWAHPLGTNPLGQGILAQLIVGTRPIMEIGLAAAVMTVFIGVVVGILSGYLGGAADSVIMRIADVFLTIPGLPLLIVLASIIKATNPLVLAAILSIAGWAGLARAVRSQVLSIRSADFIDAARVQGLPLRSMIFSQLLPNVGPYVAIHFLLDVTAAIYAEVGLFVLGVAPISGSNWGVMINLAMGEGALYTSRSMLYLLAPMAAIVILQVSLVFFTRSLDRIFNPRLRVQ